MDLFEDALDGGALDIFEIGGGQRRAGGFDGDGFFREIGIGKAITGSSANLLDYIVLLFGDTAGDRMGELLFGMAQQLFPYELRDEERLRDVAHHACREVAGAFGHPRSQVLDERRTPLRSWPRGGSTRPALSPSSAAARARCRSTSAPSTRSILLSAITVSGRSRSAM